MLVLRSLLDRIAPGRASSSEGEIVLGLPLESGDRTIYPVFLDPSPVNGNEVSPRQIGYMEISEGRSDYTSLSQDRAPLALALTLMLALLLVTLLFRVLRNQAREDERYRETGEH